MAQVYQFVDDNGVTRLFAEIQPEPAFNGGTITQPFVIDDPTLGTVFTIIMADGNNQSLIDNDGSISFSSDDDVSAEFSGTNGARGQVFATGGTGGNDVALISSQSGVSYATVGGGTYFAARKTYVKFHQTAAPDDADLVAGDCALWLDQTNGAAKLMVKAKQADGTVRAGSLALA